MLGFQIALLLFVCIVEFMIISTIMFKLFRLVGERTKIKYNINQGIFGVLSIILTICAWMGSFMLIIK